MLFITRCLDGACMHPRLVPPQYELSPGQPFCMVAPAERYGIWISDLASFDIFLQQREVTYLIPFSRALVS